MLSRRRFWVLAKHDDEPTRQRQGSTANAPAQVSGRGRSKPPNRRSDCRRRRQAERRSEKLSVLSLLGLTEGAHDLLHHALPVLGVEVWTQRRGAHPASETAIALAAAHAWATETLTAASRATRTATALA